MTERTCSVTTCEGAYLARGFCGKHYQRWKKYGDPERVQNIVGDDERRFWSYVESGPADSCWLWIGGKDCDGYGRLQVKGKSRPAHRLAWGFVNGAIPDGLYVCHTCANPPCVNPAHLWLGTNDENMADCTIKGRRPSGDRNGTRTKPESVRRGESHCRTKITWEQVQQILSARQAGAPSSQLAREYGLSHGYVNRLVGGYYRRTA
jgi:hypothetical protein